MPLTGGQRQRCFAPTTMTGFRTITLAIALPLLKHESSSTFCGSLVQMIQRTLIGIDPETEKSTYAVKLGLKFASCAGIQRLAPRATIMTVSAYSDLCPYHPIMHCKDIFLYNPGIGRALGLFPSEREIRCILRQQLACLAMIVVIVVMVGVTLIRIMKENVIFRDPTSCGTTEQQSLES